MSAEPICVCGKQMRLRRGKHGAFYGCVDYPRCDHTEDAPEENDESDDFDSGF
jgi:ssDNA-binding Zn-finger/Zn-ribbon topoisomerase 1